MLTIRRPGDSGQLADGRAFKVVLATQLADGRCDFLAVAGKPPSPVSQTVSDVGVAVPSTTAPAIVIADQVSLPYSLPD